MSGFTKGPWTVQAAEDCTGRQLDPLTKWVVTTKERDLWVSTGPTWDAEYGDESEANARLISAAPELYERLKEARDAIASLPEYALGGENIVHPHDGEVVGHYPIRDELLSNIDAALSKAAGEGR